jgi:small subunit ribosomal protein S16
MGRKKQAHFRIVVADSAAPRDGRFVETLGYYKPLTSPARLVVDVEKADVWIAKGAEPTDTVRTLLNKARKGGDTSVALGELNPEEVKALKTAALAEHRKAEVKAREEAVAAEVAQEAATAAAAELDAAEADVKAAEDDAPEAEAEEEPTVEAEEKKSE